MALLGLLADAVTARAQPAQPPRATCTTSDEELARKHFEKAEQFQAQGLIDEALDAAIEEYQLAYQYCAHAFILYNAAGAYWLGGEEKARRGDQEGALELKFRSLRWYQRYVEQEPTGRLSDKAREQIFGLAETLYDAGRFARARTAYRSYVELAPAGERSTQAGERLRTIDQAQEAARAEQQREHERLTRAQQRKGRGYRIGFFGAAGVAALTLVAGGVAGWQVRGLQDRTLDEINAYEAATGERLSLQTPCADAGSHPDLAMRSDLQDIVSLCDRGRSRATLANVLLGVSAGALLAAGLLYYRGYMRRRPAPGTPVITPTVDRDTIGATLTVSFF